jgi:hypothetical protein
LRQHEEGHPEKTLPSHLLCVSVHLFQVLEMGALTSISNRLLRGFHLAASGHVQLVHGGKFVLMRDLLTWHCINRVDRGWRCLKMRISIGRRRYLATWI